MYGGQKVCEYDSFEVNLKYIYISRFISTTTASFPTADIFSELINYYYYGIL